MKNNFKNTPFSINTEIIKTKKKSWNTIKVSILKSGNIIGFYERNYDSFYHTFLPFMQDGEWFALYSDDYTATSVMRLPSCEKIAGETPKSNGFCPVDYYVPWGQDFEDIHDEDFDIIMSPVDGKLGFVSGCGWGDDSSWKVQVFDLSKIKEGIIKRDNRFGYIPYSNRGNLRLKDVVDLNDYSEEEPFIHIHSVKMYDIHTGKLLS